MGWVRVADTPPSNTPGLLAALVVMTARDVHADPAAAPAVIPCPHCGGAGATIPRAEQ